MSRGEAHGFRPELGRGAAANSHLATVNGWTGEQAARYSEYAFGMWHRRNQMRWTLDLSVLADYGVEPPTDEEIRRSVEETRQLDQQE